MQPHLSRGAALISLKDLLRWKQRLTGSRMQCTLRLLRHLVLEELRGLRSSVETKIVKFPKETRAEVQQKRIEKQRRAILKQAQKIRDQATAIFEGCIREK